VSAQRDDPGARSGVGRPGSGAVGLVGAGAAGADGRVLQGGGEALTDLRQVRRTQSRLCPCWWFWRAFVDWHCSSGPALCACWQLTALVFNCQVVISGVHGDPDGKERARYDSLRMQSAWLVESRITVVHKGPQRRRLCRSPPSSNVSRSSISPPPPGAPSSPPSGACRAPGRPGARSPEGRPGRRVVVSSRVP